jgi:hypothetical protein
MTEFHIDTIILDAPSWSGDWGFPITASFRVRIPRRLYQVNSSASEADAELFDDPPSERWGTACCGGFIACENQERLITKER